MVKSWVQRRDEHPMPNRPCLLTTWVCPKVPYGTPKSPNIQCLIIMCRMNIDSPPARWGLLDFMSDARLLLLPPSSSSFFLLLPRRTSSASSWSQWSSPDFNRRDSARRGPRRTSTGEIRRAVGLAGLLTGPQRPETKPYRMPRRMPDRMSEDMPDRMPERYAR